MLFFFIDFFMPCGDGVIFVSRSEDFTQKKVSWFVRPIMHGHSWPDVKKNFLRVVMRAFPDNSLGP